MECDRVIPDWEFVVHPVFAVSRTTGNSVLRKSSDESGSETSIWQQKTTSDSLVMHPVFAVSRTTGNSVLRKSDDDSGPDTSI